MATQSEFTDFYYDVPDGLKLHGRIYGEDHVAAIPVVCLPGLSRNVRDFHQLALYLSRDATTRRRVVCFDYRGRGLSDYDHDWSKYNVGVEAVDVLAGLAALDIPKATFVGTSRGGLILHVLAAVRPDVLKAVVLNDIGPVLEPAGLALIKTYLGAPPTYPQTYQDAASLLRSVHGLAFSALDDEDWLDMAHAIYREIDGQLRPDFDPALLNGLTALDLTKPIPNLWPQFDAMAELPVMVVRGANSLLLSAQTVEEMRARHTRMVTETVEGQGHAPLLHKDGLSQRISAFIDGAK